MWQSIETAPKDGTAVLLFCPGMDADNHREGMPDIVVGLWYKIHGKKSWDGGKTWHDGEWNSDAGATDSYEDTGVYFVHEALQPTHWQPLPEPPEPTP